MSSKNCSIIEDTTLDRPLVADGSKAAHNLLHLNLFYALDSPPSLLHSSMNFDNPSYLIT